VSGEVVALPAAALAAVLPIGICLVDAEGTIAYANPALAEILGDPVTGPAVADVTGPAAAIWREWRVSGRRIRCELPSGRIAEGAWHALPDAGWALTVTDVTGDAQVRRRLRQHNRALAELVATKTELVSALLHEVRTPLTAARSMAAMVPAPQDPFADQALQGVGRNLRRLEDVTREIATVSGIENGTLALAIQPVDLPALLTAVVGRLGTGMRITAAEPGTAGGDPDRLAEVFERLITAVRAVHGESVEARTGDGQWLLRLPLPPGASADQLFTATGAHGNATALMFARAVIGRHGGTVGIESDDGTACLTVRLPLIAPRPLL
jgi:signal transduction histidine kinase